MQENPCGEVPLFFMPYDGQQLILNNPENQMIPNQQDQKVYLLTWTNLNNNTPGQQMVMGKQQVRVNLHNLLNNVNVKNVRMTKMKPDKIWKVKGGRRFKLKRVK